MSIHAGQQLRHLREELGLTLRDVETASAEIAARHANQEFFIPFSRLSEIETKGLHPSIFRIYTLAAVYRCDYRDILEWYEVKVDSIADDTNVLQIPKTHRFDMTPDPKTVLMPTTMDPGFDLRQTMNLSRMVQQWGIPPLQFLSRFKRPSHLYAFLGMQDFTMYPLLMPGSFLQVDESKTAIINEGWRSEYERPIYFVETRKEFICSWCSLTNDQLVLQPHPLSPVAPRIFRYLEEAEVLGQVVGVAMRLNEWRPVEQRSNNAPPARLN